MNGVPRSVRRPPASRRTRESGQVLLLLVFGLLMIGIFAGFGGLGWGRYLAFAAFAVLFALGLLGESAGWRRSARDRTHHRLLGFRRPVRIPRGPPESAHATSYRERMLARPPDRLEQAGSLFLVVVIVVVVLGGVAWVLTFLASR